jgi:hypothetical protein
MKKIRAIRINVKESKVEEIFLDPKDSRTIQKAVECDLMTACYYRANNDCLFVDDEGLLTSEPLGCFVIKEFDQFLSGHGVLVGIDEDGDSADCKSTVEEIEKIVKFVDPKWLKTVPTEPQYIPLTEEEMTRYLNGDRDFLRDKLK